jgi:hypothetical protein
MGEGRKKILESLLPPSGCFFFPGAAGSFILPVDFPHEALKAKTPRPPAGLKPGTEEEQGGEGKAQSPGEKESLSQAKAENAVLHIHRWEGEVDPEALNTLMLKVMRAMDAKSSRTEAAQARQCHMTRQQLHQLHTKVKVLTLPTLARWANGHHLDPAFFFGEVAALVRRRPLHH